MHCARFSGCTCRLSRRRVSTYASAIRMANHQPASRNSPFNTHTKAETDRQTRGCPGYMRATRPALSRAFGTLRAASRSLFGRTQEPTYFSSCKTGCSTKRMESGTSYLTMWMMLAFLLPRTPWWTKSRGRSYRVSRSARTD